MTRLWGVWDLLVAAEVFAAGLADGGGFAEGTYSFPSTFAVNRSLYSSPMSPE